MTTAIKMSEQELLDNTIEMAELFGWRVYHARPGLDRHGRWSTAMSGTHAAGFPDIVAVRERVIWIELKSENGRMTPSQQDWFFALAKAGDQERYIFRPVHWFDGTIEKTLRSEAPTP